MKKFFLQLRRKFRFSLLLLAATSFIFFSCSREEVESSTELNAAFQTEIETAAKKGAPAPGDMSIAAIALESPDFDELVEALFYVDNKLETNLVDMFLNGTDQYTVFAPTDDAFENLYTALEINNITDLPAETVLEVLLYHVVEGRRAANSVVPPKNNRKIETLLGVDFYVTKGGMIQAVGNTATITAADISASNGIIHVIDSVILPY